MRLRDIHRQAIQLILLHRWEPQQLAQRVSEALGVTPRSVHAWRQNEDFQREYARQLAIYKGNFEDIRLSDRKERVRVLNDLFFAIQGEGASSARLKMAVLEQIAREMGDMDPSLTVNLVHSLGVNAPPRADTYEQWVEQNQLMHQRLPEGEVDADWTEEAAS